MFMFIQKKCNHYLSSISLLSLCICRQSKKTSLYLYFFNQCTDIIKITTLYFYFLFAYIDKLTTLCLYFVYVPTDTILQYFFFSIMI